MLHDLIGAGVSQSSIARAHNVNYKSTLVPSDISKFRTYEAAPSTPPSKNIQEALALATDTTPAGNWTEAILRWLKAGGRSIHELL